MQQLSISLTLRSLLSSSESIPSSHQYAELHSSLLTNPALVSTATAAIFSALASSDAQVKFKALRLLRMLLDGSPALVDFKRQFQKRSGEIKQLVGYRGEPHPLKGDAVNRTVREEANKCLESLFRSDEVKTSASYGSVSSAYASVSSHYTPPESTPGGSWTSVLSGAAQKLKDPKSIQQALSGFMGTKPQQSTYLERQPTTPAWKPPAIPQTEVSTVGRFEPRRSRNFDFFNSLRAANEDELVAFYESTRQNCLNPSELVQLLKSELTEKDVEIRVLQFLQLLVLRDELEIIQQLQETVGLRALLGKLSNSSTEVRNKAEYLLHILGPLETALATSPGAPAAPPTSAAAVAASAPLLDLLECENFESKSAFSFIRR